MSRSCHPSGHSHPCPGRGWALWRWLAGDAQPSQFPLQWDAGCAELGEGDLGSVPDSAPAHQVTSSKVPSPHRISDSSLNLSRFKVQGVNTKCFGSGG